MYPSRPLVRMLGGVKKGPFGPELLYAGDNDARPDFPGCLNERDGVDVIKIGGIKNLR